MTTYSHIIVMMNVRIADLKARLSEHLRRVRRGHVVTVLDRDTPVAQIVPYPTMASGLEIRRPAPGAPAPGRIRLPEPLPFEVEITDLLDEERQASR